MIIIRPLFTHPEFKERWDRNFNFFMFLDKINNIKDKNKHIELYNKYKKFLPYPEDIENFPELQYLLK